MIFRNVGNYLPVATRRNIQEHLNLQSEIYYITQKDVASIRCGHLTFIPNSFHTIHK